MKIENLSVIRIGETDDVIVSGTVDGVPVQTHVWYSHLYGEGERCLNGDKKAIRAYVEQELRLAAAALPTEIKL